MAYEHFDKWLSKLKVAWETKNPRMAADLCEEKVLWYDTPFGSPHTTKTEVLREWQSVPESQKDIKVTYEILVILENFGIAHWNAKFTRLPSGEKAHLDGIFKVTLSEKNLCTEFRQWYNAE